MASQIDTIVNKFDRTIDPKIDLSRERSTAVIIGHSFVRNLNLEIADFLSKNWGLYSRQYLLKCDDIEVNPYLYGIKGATLDHIDELVAQTKKLHPSVLILEIGSNDLSWNSCKPVALAHRVIETAQSLFSKYNELELITICHITQKLYMWPGKGDKKIDIFNRDAVIYNEKITELVRPNIGMMKWTHRGVFNITEEHTLDGTHLNTEEGSYKYYSSICNLLRCSKKEMIMRRTETAEEAVNRRTRQKKRKEMARQQRREEEKWQNNSGEMYLTNYYHDEQYPPENCYHNSDYQYQGVSWQYTNNDGYKLYDTQSNWYTGTEDTEAYDNLENCYYKQLYSDNPTVSHYGEGTGHCSDPNYPYGEYSYYYAPTKYNNGYQTDVFM
jgi:lysophospholipase L1-like esterase